MQPGAEVDLDVHVEVYLAGVNQTPDDASAPDPEALLRLWLKVQRPSQHLEAIDS